VTASGALKIRQYQVDAFAARPFEGNPAAVCLLEAWLDDALLQSIAEENNLSETAFLVATDPGFELRWFTPVAEVDLCGHATLASAHVLFEHAGFSGEQVHFATRSGPLTVQRSGPLLEMDFPAKPPSPCAAPPGFARALGREPLEVLVADDFVAVFENEAAVLELTPDMGLLAALGRRGICVTAPGESHDFVSRFFAPRLGIPEDPVTGSAHCELAPYWSARLGRQRLQARQVSRRGGLVGCELRGDRVILSGKAVTIMEAVIRLDSSR
jgi:predicted PhzF superfamily epimerase YddE/YHI9